MPTPSVSSEPELVSLKPSYGRAVVTGGGSGIGRGVALALARAGVDVVVMGRTNATLEDTVALARGSAGAIQPVVCDIRSASDVERAFEVVESSGPPAQLLYHAAASLHHAFAIDITPADFSALIQGSLVGAFHVIHRWALKLTEERLPGAGVAVTSCNGGRESPGIAHSAAAKTGLEAFVRTAAREWGVYGIRLNAIGPGAVLTEGLRPSFDNETVTSRISQSAALGRFGEVAEIVEPSLFLLSDSASYITGEVLVVDGGYRLSPFNLHRPGEGVPGRWTHAPE